MSAEFDTLFQRATHVESPYRYQRDLAMVGDTIPKLLNIPEGLGKTAAAGLADLFGPCSTFRILTCWNQSNRSVASPVAGHDPRAFASGFRFVSGSKASDDIIHFF